MIIYTQGPKPLLINLSAFPRSLFALTTHLFTIIAIGRILSCLYYVIHYVYKYCRLDASIEKPQSNHGLGGPYLGFFVCGGNSVFVRFRTNIATRNSPAKSDTMLEKKHLVFLAGATAPFAPPLCTALSSEVPSLQNYLLIKTN